MTHTIDISPIRDRDFVAEASLADGCVHLKLVGTADARAIEPLADLLPKMHKETMRVGAPQVVVDFLGLEFMNSSCFKSFVSWIATVQETSENQYRIRFLSNPSMLWQRRSLHALSCFAADLITVESRPS